MSQNRVWWLVCGGLAALVLVAATSGAMNATSKTEYCMTCHEMGPHARELARSPHAYDELRRPIGCPQCHIPREFGPRYLLAKSVLGMKDLLVHAFGDPEDFNRKAMQLSGMRYAPDENCRACHTSLRQNAKGGALSPQGVIAHEAYLGENGQGRRMCGGCHNNVAHLPSFDRRYDVNAAFANRLAQSRE